MSHLVDSPSHRSDEMLEAVGGKALNLGVLTAAGLPVPPGFCITTPAYRTVVGDRLDDLLGRWPDGRATICPRSRPQARDRSAPGPGARRSCGETIVAATAALGDDVPVAVRSSATAEDLPDASFAGQQDTYLNVVGADAVLDAVRRCWASLWTERAVSYRNANGIDHARRRAGRGRAADGRRGRSPA